MHIPDPRPEPHAPCPSPIGGIDGGDHMVGAAGPSFPERS
jgi:hypothetical protein